MKWMSLLAFLLIVPLAAHTAAGKTSSQDDSWLIGAHQTNLAEIMSGKLAEKSGHARAVRDAGRMLATDHEKLDAKLRPVAKQLGVKLPKTPNRLQRDQMKKLKTLSGMEFDKIWTRDETDDHVKAVGSTEGEIQNGSDPQVKKLAEGALPVLQRHLRTLRQVAIEISGSKSTSG